MSAFRELLELPDDEKREVYLNSGELLPEGFDPLEYADILHPAE